MGLRGIIKNFSKDRGYGYIEADDDSPDVRFPLSALQEGLDPDKGQLVGQAVEYDRVRDPATNKPLATKVWPTSGQVPAAASSPAQTRGQRPEDTVFESFYNADGRLRQELFFVVPERTAQRFHEAGLKATQLRQLYQGFLGFARRLRDGEINLPEAREKFGAFYCARVVRQAQRGHLPGVVKNLIDAHKDLAQSEKREMLGLFMYLTNILCYFGDKDKD